MIIYVRMYVQTRYFIQWRIKPSLNQEHGIYGDHDQWARSPRTVIIIQNEIIMVQTYIGMRGLIWVSYETSPVTGDPGDQAILHKSQPLTTGWSGERPNVGLSTFYARRPATLETLTYLPVSQRTPFITLRRCRLFQHWNRWFIYNCKKTSDFNVGNWYR